MKKIKNCLISFIVVLLSVAVVSCQNDVEEYEIEKNQRIKELTDIAYTGNYKLTDTEVSEYLNSFLFANNDSRNISTEYDIKKIDKITFNTSNCNSRSGATGNYDNIDFYLYQVNNKEEEKEGLAILSNDRRIGEVLAYVDNSEFTEDITDNPFMQLFCTQLESYINETIEIWDFIDNEINIHTAETRKVSELEKISLSEDYYYSDWMFYEGNTDCILKTKWNQYSPYNSCIYAIKGKDYPTGCATTAFAQIAAFHEYPKNCPEKITTKIKNNWELGKNWNGEYDWKEIKKDPDGKKLDTNGKIMLGALMYQFAEAFDSSYSTKKTNTKEDKYASYIRKLGYKCDNRTSYSFNTIKKSIDNKRPVLIFGADKKTETKMKFLWWSWTIKTEYSGHTWVIDGYSSMKCTAINRKNKSDTKTFTTDYVHCNIGWGGGFVDGYYIDKIFSVLNGANLDDIEIEKMKSRSTGTSSYYQYYLHIIPNIRYN